MASRAKPNAPDLFENGDDFPTPSERPMELVLKTSGQKCLVGSNPTPSATENQGSPRFLGL